MKTAASILALVASASAHMTMTFPKPYGHPDSSPLDNSGANFPCKATGPESYVVTEENVWNAGETKSVKFMGSAVHGGGSCQFSLTTDRAPSKDSQWKVIHSVIGGCPSDATDENLPADPTNEKDLSSYPITLPADLPAGEYTFAWTWFNKIGNREMYMNCAPITVGGGASTGSADVSSVLGQLPDMFVANLPREQCSTTEKEDLQFPNPGQSVEMSPKADVGFTLVGAGCEAQAALGAGAGKLGSPAAPSQPSDAPAGTPTTAPTVPSNPGGVFAPGASSAAPAPSAAPTPAPEAPVVTPPTNDTPVVSPPTNNTPSSTEGVPCDTDGAIVCIGSNQFGVCNWGTAVPQSLTAGTVCSNGVISAAVKRRHSVKFPRAYLHRRHASGI